MSKQVPLHQYLVVIYFIEYKVSYTNFNVYFYLFCLFLLPYKLPMLLSEISANKVAIPYLLLAAYILKPSY